MRELEIGSVFAGHRIEALVGRGGMALVYRATQLELDRPVALKLIAPQLADDREFRTRFKRESHIAASIDHPNVVPIFHAGEAEGQLYITMRFVDGTDLREQLADGRRLSAQSAVRIVEQVAAALDAAHARGLVHRDVKPANILLTGAEGSEHVYLADFGLSKDTVVMDESGPTISGQFIGTVDYAAPEQIEGRTPDRRADVYALGCVLFHAVTGHCPYERDSDVAKLFAHLHDPPPSVTELLPQAPSVFDDIIRTALAKAPDERYSSAGELASAATEALTDAQRNGAGASRRPRPAGRPPASRGLRRRPAAMVAVSAVAAVLATAVAVPLLLDGGDETQRPPRSPAAVAPPSSPSPWRELHAAPSARQQAPAAVAGGAIWLVGGLARERATASVEGYDPVIDSWKAAPDLPTPLHHAMAVGYKGELVVLGGWIPDGAELSAETSNRVLALRGGEWVELPALRRRRAAGAAAVVGDEIVVVGGQANGELVRETEIFDGRRWRGGAPMPTPRDHLAVASDGRFLYASAAASWPPTATSAASNGMTRPPTAGRGCRPCPRLVVGWGRDCGPASRGRRRRGTYERVRDRRIVRPGVPEVVTDRRAPDIAARDGRRGDRLDGLRPRRRAGTGSPHLLNGRRIDRVQTLGAALRFVRGPVVDPICHGALPRRRSTHASAT